MQSHYNLLSEMSSFQRKMMKRAKKKEDVIHYAGKKSRQQREQATSGFWENPDIGLSKDFESTIINMFKELKKIVLKEVMEGTTTRSYQIGNFNRNRNYIKRTKWKFWSWKYNNQNEKFTKRGSAIDFRWKKKGSVNLKTDW